MAGWRGRSVAFWIGEPAAVRSGGHVEIARNQAGRAVKQRKRFPPGSFVTEDILARPDADDIHVKRRAQFGVHLGQYLVGFVDPGRGGVGSDEPLFEPVDNGRVDARYPGTAKVHANPVGLAVVQSRNETFARGHGFHNSSRIHARQEIGLLAKKGGIVDSIR